MQTLQIITFEFNYTPKYLKFVGLMLAKISHI